MTYDRLNQEFHNWSGKKSPCTFHHHDLTRVEVFDKYVKGCEYFLALSDVPQTKLFVFTTKPNSRSTQTDNSIIDMAEAISDMFPNSHVLWVDIRVQKHSQRKSKTKHRTVGTVTLAHLMVTTPSNSDGRRLINEADNAYLEDQILALYDFYDPK